MSEAEEVQLHIKVVINKSKTKVLFAEAGSDFTDVLLSFLLLPLGTIVEVLDKHYVDKAPVIGSLNTLYKGAKNLDLIHFLGEDFKKELINSTLFDSELCKLRLNIRGTQPTISSNGESYEGVFTKSAASFIITDQLFVIPSVFGSIFETLSTLGIAVEDMDGTETRNVTFGLNEIIALLKESLISLDPLTALFFPRRLIEPTEGRVSLHPVFPEDILRNPKIMILKVMLQKSTNKFIFAQADADFVNFLFNNLTISLGRVGWFLCSNTGLKNMDNLHVSVASNIDSMYLKCNKESLIKSNPTSINLSVKEANEYCYPNMGGSENQSYVEGLRMYMVSDDLTVAPLGVTSAFSVINQLKISLSDVEEVKLKVGLIEALSILKASLTSTTALTDGLIKPFLKEQLIKPLLKK